MNPAIVISNNSNSTALERARSHGIPAYHLSSHTHSNPVELDKAIYQKLHEQFVDLVILAGYMKKIGPQTLAAYKNRILNIHPALLPKYGGQDMYGINVHKAVLHNGETETGITVHLVDGDYDHGRIIAQTKIMIPIPCNAEQLQSIVQVKEHCFYVATLRSIAQGSIVL